MTNVEKIESPSMVAVYRLVSTVAKVPSTLVEQSRDTNHYCSNCKKQVTHKPYGGRVQVLHPMPTGPVLSQCPDAGANVDYPASDDYGHIY
ncbi:hypothetical protein MW887_007169 [Aspergillus wentii]|nr:hypothetical protein MW887_007169 [Aspergillus wentii]